MEFDYSYAHVKIGHFSFNMCEKKHRSATDLQGLLCTDAARNGSNTSDNRCMDWTFVVQNLSISIAQDRIADTGLRIAVLCLR